MYRIKNFIFRLRRGISWFLFSFKQSPWQEDYQLFETIEKVLLDTANYLEIKEQRGYVVGVNNKNDIRDIRLAAKLIRMRMEEHYWNLSLEDRDTYRDTFENPLAAARKDQRALQIAMRIIAEKGFYWWI